MDWNFFDGMETEEYSKMQNILEEFRRVKEKRIECYRRWQKKKEEEWKKVEENRTLQKNSTDSFLQNCVIYNIFKTNK